MIQTEARTSTFSIIAHDQQAEEWGVAVQSKFLAAAAVVSWARAGAGAVATQAMANMGYGPGGLDLMARGMSAEETVAHLTGPDEGAQHRQLAAVDASGRAAAFTGGECLDWAGHLVGDGYSCQGNILAGPEVVRSMAGDFEGSSGPLADRLVSALRAGQAAGGDRRGQQSAGLLVVREGGSYGGYLDRYIDLRVDDHDEPIEKLARLLELFYLYFKRPDPDALLCIEGDVAREVTGCLAALGFGVEPGREPFDEAAQRALDLWVGRENFEERMPGPGVIDPEVLGYLKTQARDRGGDEP